MVLTCEIYFLVRDIRIREYYYLKSYKQLIFMFVILINYK